MHTVLPIRFMHWGALALAVALVATARPAAAVPIDFESLSDVEFVTTQFSADGIVFSNALVLTAGVSLNEIDFPPSSGVRVITGLGAGAIGVALTSLAQGVSFQITTSDVAQVRFFDSLDGLLGEILVAPNTGANTLVDFETVSPLIAGVRIASQATGSAFFLTVDDVDVDFGQGAAVPEPSAFLVMACGIVVVAGGIRRRA